LSGFTWPKSNASLGSGHFNVIPLTHFLKAFRV
jgi:hypothetical protein